MSKEDLYQFFSNYNLLYIEALPAKVRDAAFNSGERYKTEAWTNTWAELCLLATDFLS